MKREMLTKEQEQALAKRWLAGDKKALDELIVAFMPFVHHMVRTKFGSWKQYKEDLIAEGFVGLILAAQRFDPAFDVRFITYAHHWVKVYMTTWLSRQTVLLYIGNSGARKMAILRRGGDVMDRGRPISQEDGDALRIACSIPVFLDSAARKGGASTANMEDGPSVEELVPNGEDTPEEKYSEHDEEQDKQRRLTAALNKLTKQQRMVVRERMKGRTLDSIGKDEKVSREWIRQVETVALRKVKALLQKAA